MEKLGRGFSTQGKWKDIILRDGWDYPEMELLRKPKRPDEALYGSRFYDSDLDCIFWNTQSYLEHFTIENQ